MTKIENDQIRKMTKIKKKKKVGENNGPLRFDLHHGWRTQARLNQKQRRKSR